MRGFFVALALLLAVGVLVACNVCYLGHVCDALSTRLDALTFDAPAEETDALIAFWESHRTFVALSASYRELDALTEALLALRVAVEKQSEVDFSIYRALAKNATERLFRAEQFSAENLF